LYRHRSIFFDSVLCKMTGRNVSSQPPVGLYRPSSFNSGRWRINPTTYNARRAPETHRFSFPKNLRSPLPTARFLNYLLYCQLARELRRDGRLGRGYIPHRLLFDRYTALQSCHFGLENPEYTFHFLWVKTFPASLFPPFLSLLIG
jgi:hypothetical protein